MTLAARIREAMGDMKPSELARRAEVTGAAVTQWLDGSTKSLKAEKAARIEAATGYRANWIVTGKGPKRIDESPAGDDQTLLEQYRDLMLDLEAIPQPRRDKLIAAIREAAQESREAYEHLAAARPKEPAASTTDTATVGRLQERLRLSAEPSAKRRKA